MLIPLLGRRHAEERLRQSEDRLRALADGLEGRAACMLDAAGHIVSWSAACERLYGHGAAEIVGRPHTLLHDEESGEGWQRRSDGSRFWGRVAITPVQEVPRSAERFCMVVDDLTRAREAAETGAVLRALLANSPSLVFAKDRDGRYRHVNDRYVRAMGLQPGDILARTDAEVFGHEHAAKHVATDVRILETGEPVEFEESAQHEDGLHTMLVRKFPIRDATGVICGIGGVITDVSARRRAEDEIERLKGELTERSAQIVSANRELESFTYTVSHDLRAPLRHINSFAQLILEESGDRVTPEMARHLGVISRSAVKLGRLIDDLLHFSRMNRLDLRREFVDLNRVVADARRDFEDELGSRRVEWKIGELPTVHADAALMRVVYTQLISNAVKFTRHRDPAVIEIDARAGDRDEVIVRVKDNGAGFDPLFKHKLFGIFQRLHHESEFEGVGIGLATVKRIVERHGGRVWAEGALDAGACIYIALRKA
jgi:PAS domain S-box-containing protein